eukprot:scaffold273514_cov22-Tisochrysis_lutea.AAC.1
MASDSNTPDVGHSCKAMTASSTADDGETQPAARQMWCALARPCTLGAVQQIDVQHSCRRH